MPAGYSWEAWIEAMSLRERALMLVHETDFVGPVRADGLRCALCGAEVSRAWVLAKEDLPTVQSFEQACAPVLACQVRRQGIERIRAPLPIVDSFLPPDSCTAFKPEHARLRRGNVD
jgi:hypothetical protein